MTYLGPSNFPCQPYFDRHVFRNFDFLAFFRISCFLCNVYLYLSFQRLFYGFYQLVSDQFGRFWGLLEKSRNPRWLTKMGPFKNDDLISTSCDVISPFCGRQKKQFLTYYLPTKSHCHNFNALEVLKGEG